MFYFIADFITFYLLTFVIWFLMVLTVVKYGSKFVMKFLGADIFTFNMRKRLKLVTNISAVASLAITVLACFF